MPTHVRVVDTAGRVLRVGSANGALFGARGSGEGTLDQASGGGSLPVTLRALWEHERPTRPGAPGTMAFLETPAMRAIAGATVEREVLDVRRGTETRRVETSAVPIRGEGHRVVGVLTFDHDVTEQHGLQAALRDAELCVMALRQQIIDVQESRLAALGKLASGIMHDMNNVLNPIMAASYLLGHHADSPDTVREYAERIRIAAEGGAALSARVARFIRQDPVHAGDEIVDVSGLIADVVEGFEPLRAAQRRIEDRVAVVADAQAGVSTHGLPAEIRVAVERVIENALEAMPGRGTLTLRVTADDRDACIAIRDSGPGMGAATRDRAFEPFFSTKRSGSAGLGLAETYGIMRRHRGDVSIESAPGEGTTVTLRFPIARTHVTNEPTRAVVGDGPLHVLVVEDDDDGRDFLQRVLRTQGHRVDIARNCREARERVAAATATSYHLMLTDVGLPDGSGWDLAAFVHDSRPEIRIGVITGWEGASAPHEVRGVEFVLQKPMRAAELLASVASRKTSTTTE